MSLSYAYIGQISSEIPPRLPNGGLDTGPQATGPWGNIPVLPEPIALSQNLLSANPPKYAERQPVSYDRPGNNPVSYPYHELYDEVTNPRFLALKKI